MVLQAAVDNATYTGGPDHSHTINGTGLSEVETRICQPKPTISKVEPLLVFRKGEAIDFANSNGENLGGFARGVVPQSGWVKAIALGSVMGGRAHDDFTCRWDS